MSTAFFRAKECYMLQHRNLPVSMSVKRDAGKQKPKPSVQMVHKAPEEAR